MDRLVPTTTDMTFSTFDTNFWFAGVIESIQDPAMQGRVQARCIGYHPDSKSLVPTADLPWAHVMLPTTSAGVSGIGATHGLVEGSWVIGFFSDGRSAQQPIVIGTIPGNPVPSRVQQTLIDSGQSISTTSADGVAGLTQSVSLNQATSTASGSYGPTVSDSNTAIDLSSYANVVSSGLAGPIVPGSSVQANSILSVVSSTNDLRASQIYDVISNNEKIRSNPTEGYGISSFISKYANTSLASMLGVSSLDGVNVNPKSGTVDVSTNYEKALDDSTAQAGMILIEHNSVRRSSASLPVKSFTGLDQYHFVISAQGQIFPKGQLSKSIDSGDGLSQVVSRGTASNTVRVCLIGGLPDDSKRDYTASMGERFTPAQTDALKRLLTVLLKKYPKAVIDGANNLTKDGTGVAPNFNVSEALKEVFPDNVNVSATGTPKVAGTQSVPVKSQFDGVTPTVTAFHDPRALYPSINYGQDYPVVGRYNGVSSANRLPPVIQAIKGNLTKFSTHEPRNASNRTAVGVIDPVQVPTSGWGGEYGLAHVIRETPGGHGIYADDTPGHQRMVLASPTGSVHETRPDGSIVHMAQGDLYSLAQGSHNIVSNGDASETVNGNKKIKIAGDLIIEVGGRFAIVSAETNEFVSGNKSSLVEGISKQHSKAGHFIEVGKDYSLQVGGNRQDLTAGTVVDQAGLSRSTVTTGASSIKSNYSVDMTLGNRTVMTRGNLALASNGATSIFSKGDLSASTAGAGTIAATGALKTFGSSIENTTGGKMSLNASGGVGINAAGGNITLDGAHYSFDEGTIADHTNTPTITTFDFPATLQPVAVVSSPESNPSAADMTFGKRQEMEAHDEMGNNTGTSPSRSAFNSGATSNPQSPANPSNAARSNLSDTVSLGSSSSSGCSVANGLVSRGMTQEAAAAYAGGFMQESRFNPTSTNSIGATGIAQWTSSGSRKEMMQSYLGDRSSTVDGQLDYVMYELKNNPNGVAGGAATTWKTNNLSDAVKSAAYYERFNGFESARNGVYAGSEWGNRAGYAASIYKDCFSKDPGVFNPAPSFDANAGLNSTPSNSVSPNTGVGAGPATRGSEADVSLPPLATKYTDRNQKISEFFTLADLLQSGGHNFDMPAYLDLPNGRVSADEIAANLSKLAVNVLDVLSRRLGKVTVNSGLRPPWYNKRIGGAKNSQHMYGRASDITIAGYTPAQVHDYVVNNIPAAHGVGRYATFTHVDVRPGGRVTWSG
jgi:hypothetical protein